MFGNFPKGSLLLVLGLSVPSGSIAQLRADTLGLPPIPISTDNPSTPEKIALGEKLFFDRRLSRDGSTSCANCHQPGHVFSDRLNVPRGVGGRLGFRNTPSLLNVVFNTSQFWDGRRDTLETQSLDPFLNQREHGLANEDALLDVLRSDSTYIAAFDKAFPNASDPISVKHVGQAIASFERTLVSGNSAFDRYLYLGEQSALSPSAKNGLLLFRGRAKCATCHTVEDKFALFSDNDFHSLNVGMNRLGTRVADITRNLVTAKVNGADIGRAIPDEEIAELGRFAVTINPRDIGKFRTPSLRNVALTAPYMHDGSIRSLREAVDLEVYYRSAEAGRPLVLTPAERNDLVDFLKSLTSESWPSPNSVGKNPSRSVTPTH